MNGAPRIRIVAAVIRDGAGRTLLVRKRGAEVFQQPGGKRDPDDADDLATLARELREELGCALRPGSARFLCHASAPAANERGHVVEAEVYEVDVDGEPRAQAEIAELRKEVKELRRANDILQAAASFFGAELDRRSKK